MSWGDATKPSKEFQREKDEINRGYKGVSRRARLLMAELRYGLALHEGGLGAPEVRENWEKHIDNMWRARRDPETQARETLLHAVVFADSNYAEPHVGWKDPRETYEHYLTDANGKVHKFLTTAVPFEREAAERAIEQVAKFDPETAGKIPVCALAAIVPVFADRHRNAGRRGKSTTIDTELCKLVRAMGLSPVTTQAIRRQREQFEEKINQRRAEELRANHLEALRLERRAHGLQRASV
jgi:hypothetical protein